MSGGEQINPKLPSWDGSWKTFTDYRFAAQLELDGCKEEEKKLLAPRLVRNLTGRAWEACLEINREELKKTTGVNYLLDYLKDKRGKQEVDLLGDALQQYFQTQDSTRKDQENLNDFEQRHAVYVRDIKKAMLEIGCQESVPTEIYGWFAINKLLRLDPSDVAMVKAQTTSYKLEDVMKAMRKMWGGDSLAQRDVERKRHHANKTYMNAMDSIASETAMSETAWMNSQDHEENLEPNEDTHDDLDESQAWMEQATEAYAEDPSSETAFANFQEAKANLYKEARKALDKHKTARGFFPVKGVGKGDKGHGKGFSGRCMRCGKIGHKAMHCRQNLGSGGSSSNAGKSSDAGRVGFVFTVLSDSSETGQDCESTTLSGQSGKNDRHVTWAMDNDTKSTETYAVLTNPGQTKAILDCGASESIVGAHTLQQMYECYEQYGLDPEESVQVDREHRRSFVFGNNQSSLALGLAHVRAGIAGTNMNVPMHVVEGQTPILLSSKWLEEQEAVINFKTGKARFKFLGDQQIQLERADTNHLLLPLTRFHDAVSPNVVSKNDQCPIVNELSHSQAYLNRPEPVP